MINRIIQSLDILKKSEYPLYCWGAGNTAERLTAFYNRYDISIDGYLQSKQFYKEGHFFLGKKVECLEDYIKKNCNKINLIIAHMGYRKKDLPLILNSNIVNVFDYDYSSAFVLGYKDPNFYEDEFFFKNQKFFSSFREQLSDIESVKAFDNFVYQKLTSLYFKEYSNSRQYFEDDIYLPGNGDVMLDCGSFDGADAVTFLEKTGDSSKSKSVICIEPDKKNFEKLNNNPKLKDKALFINKGLWNKKLVLSFVPNDSTNSRIEFSNNNSNQQNINPDSNVSSVEVDTIDSIVSSAVGEKGVGFIKMDIEGAELEALKGAVNTICKYRPKMAICVYHRKEDLIEIPKFIMGLNLGYKFYLRNYMPVGTETVLYAV